MFKSIHQKIILTQPEIDKCQQFAIDLDPDYSFRDRCDKQHSIAQAFTGKLAEIASHKFLLKYYPNITYPDFTIYKIDRKSFAADMTAKGQQSSASFQIKSQTQFSVEQNGESYLWTAGDPECQPSNDIVVMCRVLAPNLVEIRFIGTMDYIFPRLGLPKKKNLQKVKKVFYL